VAGPSGDRIPVGGEIFVAVQTGPGAHPGSDTMGARSFPGTKRSGHDVNNHSQGALSVWCSDVQSSYRMRCLCGSVTYTAVTGCVVCVVNLH